MTEKNILELDVKMEFSMENVCRTCMSDENEMVSVFDFVQESDKDQTLADILMICASIQITEGDGLPESICQQCMKQLTAAFNFKKQSEQTDATLRELTKNPGIEFIKVDEYLEPETTTSENETEIAYSEVKIENDYIMVQVLDETESEDKIYTCNICSKTFSKSGHFIKHQNSHNEVNYQCAECNIVFTTKNQFNRHKKIHSKAFTCDLCGREFRSAHGLAYHIKIHSGIKNYECPYENCNKKFALKQALDKHVCVHSKDGNHLCYLCGKMYGTYDALHYHIKTHEGLRPHVCVHCGKTFKQSCHLKSHMWIHNGIKPHECKTCGKCYTSGHQLKKHMKKYCNNFLETS